MAFWSIGGFHTVSAVERILDKEDHTIRDVLEAEDLISEVLAPNTKLIDYLRQPEIIFKLAEIVAGKAEEAEPERPSPPESPASSPTPSEETEDDTEAADLPRLATEILSVDVWCLMDSLLSSKQSMDLLWSILSDQESDQVRLTYFTKIMENVLEKRTDQVLEYIKGIENFSDLFLAHVDNPPLVDLLLKIIATDTPDAPSNIIDTLYNQNLIPRMVEKLGPETSHAEQMAVGDFLKAFVTISGGNKSENCSIGPNELSRQLVSEPVIQSLIDLMLKGGHGLGIAVSVIIEIIRKNNSDFDFVPILYTTLESHPPSSRDSIYLGTMIKLFAKAIPEFQKMLTRKRTETMEMPFGTIQPLGFERFRICELYAELLHCSNMELLNKARAEEIVKERDEERHRIYHLSKEPAPVPAHSVGNTTLSDIDSTEDAPEVSTAEDENEEENTSGTQPHDSESELQEEVTGDKLTDLLKKQEADIRNEPVIGDQLKLALDDCGCISTVFNMLFEFPWNNFLHNVVFDIVQQIFNGSLQDGYNKFLAIHLFTNDHITSRIVKGQSQSDEHEQNNRTRLGYAGHLTLISEEVVKFAAVFPPQTISPQVAECLESHEWTYYVGHTLLKLREQYNTILGGHKPDDDDEDDDDEDDDEEEEEHDQEEDEEDANNMMISVGGDSLSKRSVDKEEDLNDLDLDDGTSQFSRYMSHQLGGGATHFGSSDEDDEDDWESLDRAEHEISYQELEASDDDDDEDDDLSLVRQRSFNA